MLNILKNCVAVLFPPKLIYAKKYYRNSEYSVEFYNNGTLQIVGHNKKIIFSPKEVGILASDLNTLFLTAGEEFYNPNMSYNYVDKRKFEHHTKQFFKIVQNISAKESSIPNKMTLQNQLTDIYSNLYDSIQKTCQEAQKNGKKPLIVIGEDHNSPNSLAIELMISKICHELGIKNLLVEANKVLMPNSFEKNAPQEVLSLIVSHTGSWSITPIDPLNNNYDPNNNYNLEKFANKAACGWKSRTKAINESIAQVNKSSLAIVGAEHLSHIAQNPKLSSQYQILLINSAPGEITSDFVNKLKLMEEIPDHYLDMELKNELSKSNVNSKVCQEYIEEKKSDASAFDIGYPYLATEVVQAITLLDNNKSLTVKGLIDITLNAINAHPNDNNEGEQYTIFLKGELKNISEYF